MGKFRFNYRSEILGRYVDISIVLPTDELRLDNEDLLSKSNPILQQNRKDVYRPGMKFQTVYLIHGGGDDDTLTYRYSNIEEAAQRNKVMLVTPNVANSFGVNTKYHVRYMDFITMELPAVIQSLFPSSPARENNFIMGYAMGGNAALGIAVNHPELYSACIDISGGIGMTFCPETLAKELESEHFKKYFPIYLSTFGSASEIEGSEYDLWAVAKKHIMNGTALPAFTLVCGSEEFIRERVENDVKAMQELELDVRYICAEGYAHDFKMWNKYLEAGLDEFLPLKKQVLYL